MKQEHAQTVESEALDGLLKEKASGNSATTAQNLRMSCRRVLEMQIILRCSMQHAPGNHYLMEMPRISTVPNWITLSLTGTTAPRL